MTLCVFFFYTHEADDIQMDGDGNFDGFSSMGFDVMHNFEEVSCDAATWTTIPPA